MKQTALKTRSKIVLDACVTGVGRSMLAASPGGHTLPVPDTLHCIAAWGHQETFSLIAHLLLETPSPQLLDDIYVTHTFPVRVDDKAALEVDSAPVPTALSALLVYLADKSLGFLLQVFTAASLCRGL